MAEKLFIVSINNAEGEKLYFRSNKLTGSNTIDPEKFWRKDISRATIFSTEQYLNSTLKIQLKYAYSKDIRPDIGLLDLSTLAIEIFEVASTQKVFRTEEEVIENFVQDQLPKIMNSLNILKSELEAE